MYGYIRPNQDELRIREYTEHRAYYCGLCKCLSAEYGEIARSVLSYDCTFIALLLSGLAGTDDVQKRRCVYKPLSKPRLAAAADDMLRFGMCGWRITSWKTTGGTTKIPRLSVQKLPLAAP